MDETYPMDDPENGEPISDRRAAKRRSPIAAVGSHLNRECSTMELVVAGGGDRRID